MSVAEWAGTLVNWRKSLEELQDFIAPVFRRSEHRQSASAFIDGLLSGVERKTGWMLAEEAGHERPYRIPVVSGTFVLVG